MIQMRMINQSLWGPDDTIGSCSHWQRTVCHCAASKEACRHAPEHAWPIVTRQDLDQTLLQFDRFRRFLMHKLHCLRSLSGSLQLKAAGYPVRGMFHIGLKICSKRLHHLHDANGMMPTGCCRDTQTNSAGQVAPKSSCCFPAAQASSPRRTMRHATCRGVHSQ